MRKLALSLMIPLALLPGCFTIVGGLAGSVPTHDGARATANGKPTDRKPGETHIAAGALIGFTVDVLLAAVIVGSSFGGTSQFPD